MTDEQWEDWVKHRVRRVEEERDEAIRLHAAFAVEMRDRLAAEMVKTALAERERDELAAALIRDAPSLSS